MTLMKISEYLARYNLIAPKKLKEYSDYATELENKVRTPEEEKWYVDYEKTRRELVIVDNLYAAKAPTTKSRAPEPVASTSAEHIRDAKEDSVKSPKKVTFNTQNETVLIENNEDKRTEKGEASSSSTPLKGITDKLKQILATKPFQKLDYEISPIKYPYPKDETIQDYLNMSQIQQTKETIREAEMKAIQESWQKAIIKLNELVLKPEIFDGSRPRPSIWWQDYQDAILANSWDSATALKYFSAFLSGAANDDNFPVEHEGLG